MLREAIHSKDPRAVARCLPSHATRINEIGPDGLAPLHLAAALGHAEISLLLINHGAEPSLASDQGKLAIFYAIEEGGLEAVRVIEQFYCNYFYAASEFLPVVDVALRTGNFKAAAYFVDRGADVENTDEQGTTSLMRMAQESRPEAVRFLLTRGANARARDHAGRSALEYALLGQNSNAEQLVFQAGGASALSIGEFARLGLSRPGRLRRALQWTAEVLRHATRELREMRSIGRADKLLDCVSRGDIDLATRLIQGSDRAVRIPSDDGATVFHVLVNTYRARRSAPAWASFAKQLRLRGADPNARHSITGDTPLMTACAAGDLPLCELLISVGANVSRPGSNSRTALHAACGAGHATLVRLLVLSGANPNATTRAGDTPMHEAVAGGHISAVESLIAHGAVAWVRNRDGDTPYYYARNLEAGLKRRITKLLEQNASASRLHHIFSRDNALLRAYRRLYPVS
jgi:ankyrin repeat protein